MPRILKRTEIEIMASPDRIWNILTDLDRYEEWNPMIRHARGTVKPGEFLTLHFNPPGTKVSVFRPKVLVADKNRHFRWQGRPRVPYMFDCEHYFILEETGPGRTKLKHDMVFFGLAVPLAKKAIQKNTIVPFNLMNCALKERVEKSR